MDKKETIIFSIDINNGFCRGGALYSPRTKALIPATVKFLAYALAKGYEVTAFTDCHGEDSPEFSVYPEHCLSTDAESRLVSELEFLYNSPKARVIPKNSTNGFFVIYPKAMEKYENFIISGCCTDICVYQFAITLKAYFNQRNLRKNVIAVSSLIDTFDMPGHNADEINSIFFTSMLANGIIVVDSIEY